MSSLSTTQGPSRWALMHKDWWLGKPMWERTFQVYQAWKEDQRQNCEKLKINRPLTLEIAISGHLNWCYASQSLKAQRVIYHKTSSIQTDVDSSIICCHAELYKQTHFHIVGVMNSHLPENPLVLLHAHWGILWQPVKTSKHTSFTAVNSVDFGKRLAVFGDCVQPCIPTGFIKKKHHSEKKYTSEGKWWWLVRV